MVPASPAAPEPGHGIRTSECSRSFLPTESIGAPSVLPSIAPRWFGPPTYRGAAWSQAGDLAPPRRRRQLHRHSTVHLGLRQAGRPVAGCVEAAACLRPLAQGCLALGPPV